MSRKEARVAAMKIIYQTEITNCNDRETIELGLKTASQGKIGISDRKYIDEVLQGVEDNKDEIKGLIDLYAKDWSIERLPVIDVSIMNIAIFEILHRDDIPDNVSANEAVEMASVFSTERSVSYINGIIRSVINKKNADQ